MKLAVLVAMLLAVSAPVASAQEAPTDPDAGTPAGTIYQLPLDQARVDAAPKRPKAGATSTGEGTGSAAGSNAAKTPTTSSSASALRSENGFGSSSRVPGTEPEAREAGSSANGSRKQGSGSSGSGASDSAADSDGGSLAGPSAPTTKASAAPSSTRVYLLLALVLAVGIAGGLATRVRGRGDAAAAG